MIEIVVLLMAGAFGALARDIVKDNKLTLPKLQDGDLVLGCLGGMIVGSFVGYAIDGSLVTATLAGYAGTSAIQNLLPHLTNGKEKE